MDEYLRQTLRLATDYISQRSAAIVLRDSSGNTGTGTATCIRIGSRFLLATAGHVIEDLRDERIELLPAGELTASPLTFLARSCSPSRRAPPSDIAWMELDPSVAHDNRVQFLTLADLKPGQPPGDLNYPILVHGYPHSRSILTATSSDVESNVSVTSMARERDLHRPLNPYEIAAEYPPRDAEGKLIPGAPNARGLSGGGVWWHPRDDEVLIASPTQMKLVAINCRWDEQSAVLFAARIDEWLRLVARDFPESEDAISQLLGT